MLIDFPKGVFRGIKRDITRNKRTNYLERVEVMDDNVHPRLRNEAKLVGAYYCKLLRSSKVIVTFGRFDGNGRSYRMSVPDCGDVPWGCFVNGPERFTLSDMERIENQSVHADIPNLTVEGD